MVDMKASAVLRVVKLVDLALEENDKLRALLDEALTLLGGGAGIGAQLKEFQIAFDMAWCARYARGQNGKYAWLFTVDIPNQKRLIKLLGLQELKLRAVRFIADDRPFLMENKHGFRLFVSNVNDYVADALPLAIEAGQAVAVGCKHMPPCKNDGEHTVRKRQDVMRAQ